MFTYFNPQIKKMRKNCPSNCPPLPSSNDKWLKELYITRNPLCYSGMARNIDSLLRTDQQ